MTGILGRRGGTRAVWVRTNAPGASVTIERVNPAFSATVVADDGGLAKFERVVEFPGQAANVHIAAAGWVPLQAMGATIRDGNQELSFTLTAAPLTPVAPALYGLVPDGHVLRLADGTPWTAIETSDFQLYLRFLTREDIRPILDQRAVLGFNLLRVFGMARNLFDLDPAAHVDYYDRLGPFCALLETRGLRLEFSVFPDCALVLSHQNAQLAHWARVCDALRPYTRLVLLELQNEADQPPNAINAAAFGRPQGLLASHGSNGSQAWPVMPLWDWAGFHSNGAPQWVRKCGHNAWEIDDKTPIIANENTRYPDADSSLIHAYDAAAGAALMAAGSCFHSIAGRSSDLFEGVTLDAAKAWVAGAKSVDLACQPFPYVHRGDLEGADAGATGERTYQRGSCIVHIRGN